MKKVFYIFILLFFSITSCKSVVFEKEIGSEKMNAVWVYTLENDDNDALLDKIQTYGFNTAFVSVSPTYLASRRHLKYQNKVIDFLKKAKQRNITIHALIGEQNYYTNKENHSLALKEVDKILTFFETNPSLVIEGIQLDIEPHTLKEWTESDGFENGVRDELLSEWIRLHKKIAKKMQNSNFKLSSVITWWYDSKFMEGILDSGDISLISEYVDFIVVMAFSSAIPPYIQAEDESNIMETVVAINSQLYDSYASIQSDKDKISNVFRDNTNYLGQSIFHLDILPK